MRREYHGPTEVRALVFGQTRRTMIEQRGGLTFRLGLTRTPSKGCRSI